MRICFSIKNGASEDMSLADHFGESDLFVIFDTELQSFRPHASNPAPCRGPCHCHLPALPQREFDAVICRNIGARAFAMLRRQQIDVFLTQESNIRKALNVWQARHLQIAKQGICRPEFATRHHKQGALKEN